jgi:hypothetical protein
LVTSASRAANPIEWAPKKVYCNRAAGRAAVKGKKVSRNARSGRIPLKKSLIDCRQSGIVIH